MVTDTLNKYLSHITCLTIGILSFLFNITITNLSQIMKDNKLLIHYPILFLYLIVAFFLNTNLRIMLNVFFCLFCAFFYYDYRKKAINTQDIYFIISLILAAMGSLVPIWRHLQMGLIIEMLISIFMLTFILLCLKSRTQYLFLGTNWGLALGIILILLSLIYFTNHFLPYINDLNVPLSVFFVFILGFIFIITLIRAVNDSNYYQFFLGVCLIIGSCIVAAFSIYHNTFALNNYWEDALAMSGIFFLTNGMLKNTSQLKSSESYQQHHRNLSLLYFLKKIF